MSIPAREALPDLGPAGATPPPQPAAETPIPWMTIAWFAGLIGVLFAPVLYTMAHEWLNVEEMGHGIFVPFLAGYVAWLDRERLLNSPTNPSWFGLIAVVGGFCTMVVGILGADFFISRVGFLMAFVGVLWTLGGTWTLRRLAFPLFILLFMIRIPLFIYSQLTFPLQIIASQMAEVLLTAVGIPVLRDGNILELPSQRLSVVEACSGIRSLMSLALMSLVYGFFFDEKKWMRWVLLALSIPIAIFANGLRVALSGVISEYDKELAGGVYHTIEGLLMWVFALIALMFSHQAVNWIYARLSGSGGQHRPAEPSNAVAARG